jgi:hypothetical protein
METYKTQEITEETLVAKDVSERKIIRWSPEVAYSVGVIVVDGELSPDGLYIELVSKNREQVQNVKDFLQVQAKITAHDGGKLGKGKARYKMRWRNAELHHFLNGIGFKPYKSLSLGELKIPDEYFFDFLRGCQDGDTCFSSYLDPYWRENNLFYLVFSSASFEHIIWLQETIYRLAGVKGSIARSGNTARVSNLKYAKMEAIVVLSHMHLASVIVPPSRKKLKINRALAIVGISLVPSG